MGLLPASPGEVGHMLHLCLPQHLSGVPLWNLTQGRWLSYLGQELSEERVSEQTVSPGWLNVWLHFSITSAATIRTVTHTFFASYSKIPLIRSATGWSRIEEKYFLF